MSPRLLAAAALTLLALGVTAVFVLTGRERTVLVGPEKDADASGRPDAGRDPGSAALRGEIEALRAQLDASRERVRELEAKRGAEAGGEPAPGKAGGDGDPKAGADAEKKGKGKGGFWDEGKGEKARLPEGVTREEQDARVAALVDAHDWDKTAEALRALMQAGQGGRGVSLDEKEHLGSFFALLGELQELGVDFFDHRVARRSVPAMVSRLGANLDEAQQERITALVDETGRSEELEPEPDPPLLYAQRKARDIRSTIRLESQMATILRPDQFEDYLAGVGDDPHRSGFAFKTAKLACQGRTAYAVAEEVARTWVACYGLEAGHQAQAAPFAARLVSNVLALPVPDSGLEAWARRRGILERAARALDLQGDAERDFLLALPLTVEQRAEVFAATCPVLDLVLRRDLSRAGE